MTQLTLKDLKPNSENPRKITPKKRELLKKALIEFGDLSGFVYNRKTNSMVGGHQRLTAMPKEARVVVTKRYEKPTDRGTTATGYVLFKGERFSYREVAWDSTREKAANIAANKSAGDWDQDLLGKWMQELSVGDFDLDLTMFDEDERKGFFSDFFTEDVDEEKANAIPKPPKVAKTKRGDVYLLGQHRLLCGDSTCDTDLKKLLGKVKADITFTSPPYNANTKQMMNGKAEKLYENDSDNLSSVDYVKFASNVLAFAMAYTSQYVFWNVNYNSNSRCEFIKQILPHLDRLDETIAWKKTALPVPYGLTRTWEPVFVFRCHDEKKRLGHKNVTEFNYWEISNLNALDESHRAAFPIGLPLKALELVTDAESIFDPFGGSGTTMIAAEKLGKKCFMMELDPIYCDVIVKRWEDFTGSHAKRV